MLIKFTEYSPSSFEFTSFMADFRDLTSDFRDVFMFVFFFSCLKIWNLEKKRLCIILRSSQIKFSFWKILSANGKFYLQSV